MADTCDFNLLILNRHFIRLLYYKNQKFYSNTPIRKVLLQTERKHYSLEQIYYDFIIL